MAASEAKEHPHGHAAALPEEGQHLLWFRAMSCLHPVHSCPLPALVLEVSPSWRCVVKTVFSRRWQVCKASSANVLPQPYTGRHKHGSSPSANPPLCYPLLEAGTKLSGVQQGWGKRHNSYLLKRSARLQEGGYVGALDPSLPRRWKSF